MLPLTETDQRTLLAMAREALVSYVNTGELPAIPERAERLRQSCGVFVTLHKGRNLRGCIGVVETDKPLYTTVRECAVLSGTNDPRFSPVSKEEVSNLHFEISVLSPPADISPESVVVGTHGLLISQGPMRGLLLPQVAVAWKWNREKFLEETCRKAGLPLDAWRRGARIRAFTAQVFEEEQPSNTSHPTA